MAKSSTNFASGWDAIVRSREPLAPHTWLGIGGPAEYFAEPRIRRRIASGCAARGRRRTADSRARRRLEHLVRDEGVAGVVVRLSAPAFSRCKSRSKRVTAGGGAQAGARYFDRCPSGARRVGRLVGIPGTIGGALHGNAGSHGGDIGQWTCQADVMTRSGEIITRRREELVFAYRESSLDELVILEAQIRA